jgi:hypothetical protein
MNDELTVTQLRRAMDATTREHHLDPGVAETAWSAGRAAARPRLSLRTGIVVAASMIIVAGIATALAFVRRGDSTTASGGSSACSGNVATSSLPTWARDGFSPSNQRVPHVLSDRGQIVGILFVTLRAHQAPGTNNKILWVAKDGYGTLGITARLEGSDRTATRTVDLGPSFVDLPARGCWRMTLTWSGHRDTIAFRYR